MSCTGKLALEYCNMDLPVVTLHSAAGYYLGTWDEEGPVSRESMEYWPTEKEAQAALASGEWTQKQAP